MKHFKPYDPKEKEQELELKDSRKIWKTHNGFRSFVESKNGEVTKVSNNYYLKAKRLGVGKNKT